MSSSAWTIIYKRRLQIIPQILTIQFLRQVSLPHTRCPFVGCAQRTENARCSRVSNVLRRRNGEDEEDGRILKEAEAPSCSRSIRGYWGLRTRDGGDLSVEGYIRSGGLTVCGKDVPVNLFSYSWNLRVIDKRRYSLGRTLLILSCIISVRTLSCDTLSRLTRVKTRLFLGPLEITKSSRYPPNVMRSTASLPAFLGMCILPALCSLRADEPSS